MTPWMSRWSPEWRSQKWYELRPLVWLVLGTAAVSIAVCLFAWFTDTTGCEPTAQQCVDAGGGHPLTR